MPIAPPPSHLEVNINALVDGVADITDGRQLILRIPLLQLHPCVLFLDGVYQVSHLVHRDLPVVLGRLRLHQVPALVPVAEEQFVLRDIVRKARYAIRPELQTDAVCIAASPQLLDLISVESAADDEMVVDAVCLLSVFRAADILELLAELGVPPLQAADVILQIALSTFFCLWLFSRP